MTFATLATIHELLVNNVDKKRIRYEAADGAYKAYYNSDEFDADRSAELEENKAIACNELCVAHNALTDFENHDFT